MATSYPVLSPDERSESKPAKKRSAWRKRLIEAEGGFSFGFRYGSTLFGQIFVGLIFIITAMTLRISFEHWVVMVVAMSGGLSAELFYLTIRVLAESLEGDVPQKAIKLSAAAMIMAMVASVVVILFVLGSRLQEILD